MLRWLHRTLFPSVSIDYEVQLAAGQNRIDLLERENQRLHDQLLKSEQDCKRVTDWIVMSFMQRPPIYGTAEWTPPTMQPLSPQSMGAPSRDEAREAQEKEFLSSHDLETRAEQMARLRREAQQAEDKLKQTAPPN